MCVQLPRQILCFCNWHKKILITEVISNDLLTSQQAKRAEPSTVVDYEKIDEDARVSHEIWNKFGILVL